MQKKQVSCGLELSCVPKIEDQLNYVQMLGYHFLVIPLVHPRYKRKLIPGKCVQNCGPFTRSDMILSGSDWSKLAIGEISSQINVDSDLLHVRRNSESMLDQELTLATHLGLQVVLVRLKSIKCVNLGRMLYTNIGRGATSTVWARVPLAYRPQHHRSDIEEQTVENDPWEWWNQLRSVCNYHKQVRLALELSNSVPTDLEVDRWLGEPVQCLIVPTSIFLTNKHGYPVIARAMQQIIRRFLALNVQFVVKEKLRHKDMFLYHSYISHLAEMGPLSTKCPGFEDFLQFPLQPLKDNLEAQVYEIFEKDPVKYSKYQLAIQRALEDRVPEDRRSEVGQIVMVVGAGRGPLVQASLNAAEITGIRVKVYAIEKNPHAVNTLYALNNELWKDRVEIVETDMRHFDREVKTDILVSELLGSFGDNELSPECLDGIQHLLKEDGISIPCAYTSYLAPLHSPKMLTEIRAQQPADKTLLYCFETIYVVHLVNQYQIAPAQACWTFRHPNKSKAIDNSREITLRYQARQNCILNGFAGYFDTELYKGIMLSIEPQTYSDGMISWFPVFFPLQEAVPVKANETIEVSLWRCVSKRNVWYEWCVNRPFPGPMNNVNGRSSTITL